MPDEWKELTFNQLANVEFSGVDKKATPGEQGVRLCNYLDVIRHPRLTNDIDYMLATAKPSEITRFTLLPDDVVFTKDSEVAEEIAEAAVVDEPLENVVCGYHLGVARPRSEVCSGRFLAHLVRLPQVRAKFSAIANGVVRFGLTLDATRQLGLIVPPLVEQQRIAALLDTWDDAIAAAEQLVKARRMELNAIVQQTLLADRKASVRLGEIAVINPPSVKLPPDALVSFIAMEDVTEMGAVSQRTDRRRGDLGSGYTSFAEADTLVAKITPCFENGKGAFAHGLTGGRGLGSTEFHVLRARGGIDPRFLYHHTRTIRFRQQGESMMSGSAGQKRVPRDFIEDYRVPQLDAEEQRRAVALLDAAEVAIENTVTLATKIRRQKLGLMQKLLTGEWRMSSSGEAFVHGGSVADQLETAE